MEDGTTVQISEYVEEEKRVPEAKTSVEVNGKTFRVLKLYPKQQKVMSVVYAPMEPDAWDDFMTAAEIEKMSDFFMANHQSIDEQHDMVAGVGTITQSFLARKGDPDFPEGSWVVEIKVTNETVWQKILSGEYKAFSFCGTARRNGNEVELESVWYNEKGERVSPYAEAK